MSKLLFTLEDKTDADKSLLGGKGYYVKDMASIDDLSETGVQIPPATILTTDLWREYSKNSKKTIEKLKKEIVPEIVRYLSSKSKDGSFPLVSVRSGAPVSMPGMMDTILNLGVNQGNVEELVKTNPHAYDCYKRFLTMFGEIALGIDKKAFNGTHDKNYKNSKEINKDFEKIYKDAGFDLPNDNVENQLLVAIVSVLKSWDNERAKVYREIQGISEDIGTAVVIQKMVFGNKNEKSATGVLFTRDPSSGKATITGEFLINAQGEDVVAGVRTPTDIMEMRDWNEDAYNQVFRAAKKLEEYYGEVQDIEFTIEDGQVYFLQTRTAKRTPLAAIKIALDFAEEGKISSEDVFKKVSLKDYLAANSKQIDPSFTDAPDGVGLPASTGVLIGQVVFDLRGTELVDEKKILLAHETTPDDMPVLKNVDGVITAIGGVTSHAAVVARSLNKCAIVGSEDLKIFKEGKRENWYAKIGTEIVKEGDFVTMDAETGRVWASNAVPIVDGANDKVLVKLEDLVFKTYPLIRSTSDVDDVITDMPTLYASYPLDELEDEKVKSELFDACEFINNAEELDVGGVLDLTGKLDFLSNQVEQHIPFMDNVAQQVFERKAEILLEYYGEKSKMKVYLGKYHDQWEDKFVNHGFSLLDPNNFVLKLNSDNFKIDKENLYYIANQITEKHLEEITNNPNKKLAISAKNAMLSLLK